jgi:hypothetical protein
MHWLARGVAALTMLALAGTAHADAVRPPSPSDELNTLLMHSTFFISGQKKNEPLRASFGSIFAMALPKEGSTTEGTLILVTAAHVLNDIAGDQATLTVRRPKRDGTYEPYAVPIQIRRNDTPLYVQHPTADVAVLYGDLPSDVPITGAIPAMLATDESMADIEVHPGDEVHVLGFPLAMMATGAFPILRSARIASYPLTPAKTVKGVWLDLFLYPGNSGGPVYYTFVNRFFKKQVHLGVAQGILGLVIQESRSGIPEFMDKPLNLGVIVPATFIKETIDLLVNDTTGTIKPYP